MGASRTHFTLEEMFRLLALQRLLIFNKLCLKDCIIKLFSAGPLQIVDNIILDSFIEELGLLRDCAEVLSKAVNVVVFNVLAIDDYASFAALIEAQQQFEDSGLSASRGAHNDYLLALLDVEGDVLQSGLVSIFVLEAHVSEGDFSLELPVYSLGAACQLELVLVLQVDELEQLVGDHLQPAQVGDVLRVVAGDHARKKDQEDR